MSHRKANNLPFIFSGFPGDVLPALKVCKLTPPRLEAMNIDSTSAERIERVLPLSTNLQGGYLLLNAITLPTRSPKLKQKHPTTIADRQKRFHALPEDVGSNTTPELKKEHGLLDTEPADGEHFHSETQEVHNVLEVNMKYIVSVYSTSFKALVETHSD